MRCYEVLLVYEDHTGPLPGLACRPVPDPGSPPDLLAEGIKRRIAAGR
jgi:hypothetical protein